MCGGLFGGGKKDRSAEIARQREAQRQDRIRQGMTAIDTAYSGFNPDFFTSREQAYNAYAMPQLDDKYAEAKKQLAYALERKGLSASSAAADQLRKLSEQYSRFGTDVVNAGKSYANKARTDIENSRGNLIAQLNASEDPTAAAAAASRQAELLSAPPTFDPLASFIFDIGTGLKNMDAAGGYTGLARSPLFQGGGSGGGRVTYNS